MSRVIVIGGGPAGMMAAITAAEAGSQVSLLEQNEKLGKKLFITGKGRCNITNAGEPEAFFANVVTNPKFLYSAFYDFDNRAVIRFLDETGCKVKEERGSRVFPQSDHSSDVIGALKRRLDRSGVKISLNTAVKKIMTQQGANGITAVTGVVLADGSELAAGSVVIATGGASYPSTGSTGDGYRFARETGHKVTDVFPSLVPFTVKEDWCRAMQGLSLKNVAVVFRNDEKILYKGFGEMLFTHFGVSGPLILTASSFYAAGRAGRDGPIRAGREMTKLTGHHEAILSVDLKPALTTEQLDKRLLRDFEHNNNKLFKNILPGLLPDKMHQVMLALSAIPEGKKVHEITREERSRVVKLLKNLEMTVTGVRGLEEAIITRGGVAVSDIKPSTMESKKVKGLFFAGEVLDTDALTGGFNLQVAWSTGHLAGYSAHVVNEGNAFNY